MIIVATVTPDMFFPATACLVQDRLGAKGAWGFDLSAACSGFPYALQVGAKLVESGMHKKVLVIGADVMSSIIDYTDRATCVIFGDGAGAVLLEPCEGDEVGLIDYFHEIDGSGAAALNMPGGGSLHPPTAETVEKKMHYVHQDGQAVYKFAVRKMAEAAETRADAEWGGGQGSGVLYSASGEQADHPFDGGAAGDAGGVGGHQHRSIWKYDGGDDSDGDADGAGGEAAEEGRSCSAGQCWGRVYGWGYLAAVGVLGRDSREPPEMDEEQSLFIHFLFCLTCSRFVTNGFALCIW